MNDNIFKKNKVFWIGVIVGVFIITSVIVIVELNPVELVELVDYVAIDDVWFGKSGSVPDYYYDNTFSTDDLNYLHSDGGDDGTANPSYTNIYIRFDLKNKPRTWTKCEISLYVYKFKDPFYSKAIAMDIFEGNWSESSGNTEVYWKIERIGGIKKEVGFDKTDITQYIENIETDTFSIRIYARGGGVWESGVWIYSSEWDGNDPSFPYILPESDSYKNYLPQLIWS